MSASTHYTLTCLDNWLPCVAVGGGRSVGEEVQLVGACRRFSSEKEREKRREGVEETAPGAQQSSPIVQLAVKPKNI